MGTYDYQTGLKTLKDGYELPDYPIYDFETRRDYHGLSYTIAPNRPAPIVDGNRLNGN